MISGRDSKELLLDNQNPLRNSYFFHLKTDLYAFLPYWTLDGIWQNIFYISYDFQHIYKGG
jgi:hypothetical protein